MKWSYKLISFEVQYIVRKYYTVSLSHCRCEKCLHATLGVHETDKQCIVTFHRETLTMMYSSWSVLNREESENYKTVFKYNTVDGRKICSCYSRWISAEIAFNECILVTSICFICYILLQVCIQALLLKYPSTVIIHYNIPHKTTRLNSRELCILSPCEIDIYKFVGCSFISEYTV